ncbi:hypothetical protein LIER_16468 [Lithospermum erythrorhizon]|uniref:Uncharacterized protein n=1 Tax=Lithospermum erythrorhizon TaxID=34254 RepID=A0AAV3Q996_LITER
MVVPLGPGKFYGSSLPRPRIYTDIKFNNERVDPPVSVSDPLLSWAHDAHWSMGGLSFQRHRLQGRIEGNIKKLRSEREKAVKKRDKNVIDNENNVESPVPPPAPKAVKRRRRVVEEVEEEVEDEVEYKRRTVRKLKEEFDLVATNTSPVKRVEEDEGNVVERGRGIGRRLVKGFKAMKTSGTRLSKSLFN